MGKPDIVAIEKGNVFSFGMADPQITGCAHAPVFMVFMFQVGNLFRIFAGIVFCDMGAAITRSVINQQQFPMRIGLGKNAFNGFLDEFLFIEENYDCGDQRLRIDDLSFLRWR